MRTLYVYIEISGSEKYVGKIVGDTPDNAQFAYDNEYIAAVLPPISISLPISVQPFSAERTRNFFEGLLPIDRCMIAIASDKALVIKTHEATKNLIASMVTNSQQIGARID